MFHYGHFVLCENGRLARAGDDWGPTLDSYKLGDRFATKDGVKAMVADVIKGQEAELNEVDVMILVEERQTNEISTSDWVKHVRTRMAAARPRRVTSWPQVHANVHDQILRAVRGKIYARPHDETLQDFQINHLLWLLGKDWFYLEMAKPLEERHIILRWRHELYLGPANRFAAIVRRVLQAPEIGEAKALQVLADDVYQLAQALDRPSKVIEQLRNINEFQAVRYEILVASLFARLGFQIEFLDDTTGRNRLFIVSKGTERIAFVAKSRHGAGVEREALADDAPAQVKRLYESALGQNPGGLPFAVFVDVNLPVTPHVPMHKKNWVREARQAIHRIHSDTPLILTNFGRYFSRSPQLPGEFMIARYERARYEIAEQTWTLLQRALSEYGLITNYSPHSLALHST
jgi:hypothetical protein